MAANKNQPYVSVRKRQGHDLAKRQRDLFFSTTFSRPFKDQSGAWRNSASFGLYEALLTVAAEAKEWITATR